MSSLDSMDGATEVPEGAGAQDMDEAADQGTSGAGSGSDPWDRWWTGRWLAGQLNLEIKAANIRLRMTPVGPLTP